MKGLCRPLPRRRQARGLMGKMTQASCRCLQVGDPWSLQLYVATGYQFLAAPPSPFAKGEGIRPVLGWWAPVVALAAPFALALPPGPQSTFMTHLRTCRNVSMTCACGWLCLTDGVDLRSSIEVPASSGANGEKAASPAKVVTTSWTDGGSPSVSPPYVVM